MNKSTRSAAERRIDGSIRTAAPAARAGFRPDRASMASSIPAIPNGNRI
jgi:hypothetical protein